MLKIAKLVVAISPYTILTVMMTLLILLREIGKRQKRSVNVVKRPILIIKLSHIHTRGGRYRSLQLPLMIMSNPFLRGSHLSARKSFPTPRKGLLSMFTFIQVEK